MATYTESFKFGDIVRRELSQDYCREGVIVASGQNMPVCAVVGKTLFNCPDVGTAYEDNTGNGTMTLVDAGKSAKLGMYEVTCRDEVTGRFEVIDPDGYRLADAFIGKIYTSAQIEFTLSGGDTDFVVDDYFTVEILQGDMKVKALNPTATDGTQIVAGITVAAYDATAGDIKGAIVRRDAVVVSKYLAWPSNITDDQKAAALAELKALGIINREGA